MYLAARLLWPCKILFTAESRIIPLLLLLFRARRVISLPDLHMLECRRLRPWTTSFLPLYSLSSHPPGFQYYPNAMTLKFILSGSSSFALQTRVIHCWLDISTWMSHRYHILNLSKTESLPPFLWSHKIPHFRKWGFHSSSWLGSKPWNYPCLFFSPFIPSIQSTENLVNSTSKYIKNPTTSHHSLLLPSQVQDTISSHLHYGNNLLTGLPTAILAPRQLLSTQEPESSF